MKKLIISLIAMCFILAPLFASATFEALNEDDNSVIVMHEEMIMFDFIEFMRLTSDPTIKHYEIIIHSLGGNAITCIAVMNRILELKREGVTFTTRTYGAAMSAGAYIFLMGDERIMYEASTLMFHTMQSQANEYQWANEEPGVRNMIVRYDNFVRNRFKEITGMSDRSCKYWLDGGDEQYMSAETAYNVGIATEYILAGGN